MDLVVTSTVVLFIAGIISLGLFLAILNGLQFKVNKPDCPEDINAVKNNIKALKIGTGIVTGLIIISIVLLSLI